MAKAKCVNLSAMTDQNIDMNLQQDVDITDEIIDPDLFLRTFGISDDYCNVSDHKEILDIVQPAATSTGQGGDGVGMFQGCQQQGQKQSVIIKNDQMRGGGGQSQVPVSDISLSNLLMQSTSPMMQTMQQQQPQQQISCNNTQMVNSFASSKSSFSPITLEHRSNDNQNMKIDSEEFVSIPISTLHNILSQPGASQSFNEMDSGTIGNVPNTINTGQRKRRQEQMTKISPMMQIFPDSRLQSVPVFTVPSPVAISPVYVDQKLVPMNTSDEQIASRPSPQSTPPPMDSGGWKKFSNKSGRVTPTGKRSRPHTPISDSESDGGWRDREPLSWSNGRNTPVEMKPNVRLEDLVDEDKYNKRKRSTSGGEGSSGRRKDPMKLMLEQLQQNIPHIGNPDEEKVSHAGLLLEGSDYIRSLKRENNTTQGNVEHLKLKIEQLNAEIEAFQDQLPEHGSSIHRILSKRGKSIPDMFADHVRQKTQSDWRYWVYTSIMGHFVHSFAQEVSNISPDEMEKTSIDWVQEKMSMSSLRKDAFRKLAKLSSKTSIMEDPSKLPEEARGFVALSDADQNPQQSESGQ